MLKKIYGLLFIALLLLTIQNCNKKNTQAGIVTFVKGEAFIKIKGKETKVKIKTSVIQGSEIRTTKNGIVIIQFSGNSAKIEIQPNSSYKLDKYNDHNKLMSLNKGNAWLWSNKLKKDQKLSLRTPVTVAGVRGTKFFTFFMPNDIIGTCHCEGSVNFKNSKSSYAKIQHKHDVVFIKGNKTVVVGPKEAKKLGLPIRETHRHSLLSDSPLGPQVINYTPKQLASLLKFLKQGFANQK